MIILAMHVSQAHDGCAVVADDYEILSAVQLERLTRVKGDGRIQFTPDLVKEALRIAGKEPHEVRALVVSRGGFFKHHYINSWWEKIKYENYRRRGKIRAESLNDRYQRKGGTDIRRVVNIDAVLRWLGLPADVEIFDCNHHFAHALSALFFTEWEDALLYTADGGGDRIFYSMRHLRGGELRALYGGNYDPNTPLEAHSMGRAYSHMTEALGYRKNRHEGKLTGLSAHGKPAFFPQLEKHFWVDSDGIVRSSFGTYGAMREKIFSLAKQARPEDAAASIQKLLESCILQSVGIFLRRTGARNIGLAGGIFANVALNRRIAELPGVEEVFIFPGMGDEGLPVGGLFQFLLRRDGMQTWLSRRRLLRDVYLGGEYEGEIRAVFDAPDIARSDGGGDAVARLLASGGIVALYCGRMEFGPRALGGRSILASPADSAVNDTLNRRLERTEFMPFAPYVLEEDADSVFEISGRTRYAMRFMTITCKVRDEWREKIPAVVHVDGTARPQIIRDSDNPLYAEILRAFKKQTGLPVLVNTSFNAHEEPIIRTPQECLRALRDRRVDYVATAAGVYENRRL